MQPGELNITVWLERAENAYQMHMVHDNIS